MSAPAPIRVLFVDDEERIVRLLSLMFRNSYEVYTATSGAQALEIVRTKNVHVLVSDQRMPGMSGVELLSSVREISPDTVRLLLTGYSDLTAVVDSVNDGEVFRFLSKPWDQQEIRSVLALAAEIALLGHSAAPAPAPQAAASARTVQPGLLVLDDHDDDRRVIAKLIETDHQVHQAGSIPEALQLLERHDIGVMICESHVGNRDTGELLHVLKDNFPAIITVMLTQKADSDTVIKLINQARIYRFATKPVRTAVLKLAVAAAMKEHLRCRTDQRHAARHRPVVVPTITPAVAGGILQGLKALTARWRLTAR